MIDWESESFHPVVNLPEDYKILDLTKGPWISGDSGFSIGKYDEFRPNVYNTDLFKSVRNIHVGIDIGGPIGTPCMAFMEGKIFDFGYNPAAGDYGNVVITEHIISSVKIWSLYGHLDSQSIINKKNRYFNSCPTNIIDDYKNKIPVIWSNSLAFQKFQRYIFGEIPFDNYINVGPVFCN